MKYGVINQYLNNEKSGIQDCQMFGNSLTQVRTLFNKVFGVEQMNRIAFSVNNTTEGSGYTPMTIPIPEKSAIIKLGIGPNDSTGRTIFQFSHELTHVVFWSYLGQVRPFADAKEEEICSAASLMAIKKLCPKEFDQYNEYVKGLENASYREGANLASSIKYDWSKLKGMIETFPF